MLATHIELSTAHLTKEVADILDTLQDTAQNREVHSQSYDDWRNGVVVCPYRYGFWVRRFLDADMSKGMPDCLKACFDVASANGATWILFDRDADVLDHLPHYENW